MFDVMSTIADAVVELHRNGRAANSFEPQALPDQLIALGVPANVDWTTAGSRGERLARAARMGLPVPAGAVIRSDLLGTRAPRETATNSPAALIDELFDDLADEGRHPLMVSLSCVSPPNSVAEAVATTRAIATRTELMHAIRCLSATATILGDEVAVIVQHDVTPVRSGALDIDEAHRARPHVDPTMPGALRSRLLRLTREIRRYFPGERIVTWALDAADEIWIIDIGPEQLPTLTA